MAKKSILQMSPRERRRHSLQASMFRTILTGTVILGSVMLLIGLALYIHTLAAQCITNSFNMSRNAAFILENNVDLEKLCLNVMSVYDSTPEEEWENGSYTKAFKKFEKDQDYRKAIEILRGFYYQSEDITDIYLAMYEREHNALVYIADPSNADPKEPGDRDIVSKKEVEKFLSWNGVSRLFDFGRSGEYGWICTSGIPLYDESGEIFGFVLADASLKNLLHGINRLILYYICTMVLIMLMLGYVLHKKVENNIVSPINNMTDVAAKYIMDRRTGVSNREHFASMDIRTGNEVEKLALVMADMEREVSDYEVSIRKAVAEKERIDTELALATRIQADMIPNDFPAFPERTEFDIYATMKPAKEVGGDFYDFFMIDDDHLGLAIADVSGKGIPAALFMMVSIILVHNFSMSEQSPAKVLEMMNKLVCSKDHENMFVTIWLGILDLKTGVLTAASAGHEYPVMKAPEGDFKVIRDPHGFVVGGVPNMKYSDYQLQLEAGTKLFLYTDGVVEAMNEDIKLYGLSRLKKALNKAKHEGPKEILDLVYEDICAFTGEAQQFDDITMMCLEYRGLVSEEGL